MHEILALVGKGKKLARDLDREEAARAMRIILEGKASPHQIGAFLIAMRMKGESEEELAAFIEEARRHGKRLENGGGSHLVDLPAYAGKKSTFHAQGAFALVMAAAGVPVLMHGIAEAAGKTGPEAMLSAAGVAVGLSPEAAARCLAEVGFAYVQLSRLNPKLCQLLSLRSELGVRTVINTMMRIYDPAGARRHMIGITHRPYLDLLANTLLRVGVHRALIFRGLEGEGELALHPESVLVEVAGGRRAEIRLSLSELGIPAAPKASLGGTDPEGEAKRLRRLLSGEERGPLRDLVLLNAGVGIYAGGRAESIAEGIALAREALDCGAAEATLGKLVAWAKEGR